MQILVRSGKRYGYGHINCFQASLTKLLGVTYQQIIDMKYHLFLFQVDVGRLDLL